MSGEAMPTGRERPGEHWNARLIREEAEARAAEVPGAHLIELDPDAAPLGISLYPSPANGEYREPMGEAREAGLVKRNQQRLERANDKLVDRAYAEMRLRILADLDYQIQQRRQWIRYADDETEEFWLRMRGQGVPDRRAELDAYQRLHTEIRAIEEGA